MEPDVSPLPEPAPAPPRVVRRSFFRDVPWHWSDVFIGLAPYFLALATFDVLSRFTLSAARASLWLLATQTWMLVYPLSIARRRRGGSPHLPRFRAFFVEAPRALLALLAVIAAIVVMLQIMPNLVDEENGQSSPGDPFVQSPNRFLPLAFMILAVLVAPVAEEIFFRGMLYNALRQRVHPVVAAVLQAVVFGLVHFPLGVFVSAAAGVVGVILVVVYEWRRTLLAPVLLHSLVNALGFAITALSVAASANAPILGVSGAAQKGGCLITEVLPDSAADTAGLRVGDLVTAVESKPVVDIPSIARIVRWKRVGEAVSVEFIRDENRFTVDAVLQRRQH
jgi:membrane protease YdiL (CAAX protease family)